MVGVGADGLELADAVLLVEPDERVGRKAAVGSFDDQIELLAVGRKGAQDAVGRERELRGLPRGAMDLDAPFQIVLPVDASHGVTIGELQWLDWIAKRADAMLDQPGAYQQRVVVPLERAPEFAVALEELRVQAAVELVPGSIREPFE